MMFELTQGKARRALLIHPQTKQIPVLYAKLARHADQVDFSAPACELKTLCMVESGVGYGGVREVGW